jgi:hypothetical protein
VKAVQLDVRIPIGLLFSIFGVLLAVSGLMSGGDVARERPLGIHINLDWGLVLLLFGAAMLALARRSKRRQRILDAGGTGRGGDA